MIREVLDKARRRTHDLYQTDVVDFSGMCTIFDLLNEVEEDLHSSGRKAK